MIRVKATFDTQALDGLQAFVDQFADVAYEAFEETVQEIEPVMLQELRDTPSSPKYPIKWASERQRRAFFATDGFGRGIPTRRTGKVQAGWQGELTASGNSFSYAVFNAVSYAPFVYGSLAQNRTAAIRFQQPFHQDTGWQAATDTVSYWQNAIQEDFSERLQKIAQIRFTRRAYTRTPKRTPKRTR